MTHRTMRPSDRSTLSPALLQYTEEAGAGGYLWRDAALQQLLDPKGVYRAVSVGVSTGAATLALIGLLVAAISHGAYMGVLGVLALLAGVFTGYWGLFKENLRSNIANAASPLGHLRLIPWWSWALLGYAAAPLIYTGYWGVFAVAVLCAVMLTSPPRSRGPATACAALTGALLGWSLPATLGLMRPGLAVLCSAAVLVLVALRAVPDPLRRVHESDMRTVVPPPPSTLPWIMHLVPSLRSQIASPPWEIARKTIGAVGERRMGVLLLALKRWRGTRIAHDLMIPGAAQANIDHLVIARSGIYVIDTKQFGSKGDEGAIAQDHQGQIVHRTMRGSRSIEQSLTTAVWAVRQIETALGVSGVRAVLAVFTATVPANMVVHRNGVNIEIVSAWALPDIIDRESAPAHPGYGKALMLFPRLRSASTNGRARFIAPHGATRGALEHIRRSRSEHTSGVETPPLSVPSPSVPTPQEPPVSFIPEPTSFAPVVQPPATPRPAIRQSSPPREVVVPEAPTADIGSAEDRIRAVVEERWRQMDLSDPAPVDEIAEDMRGLDRGERLTLVEFSDSTGATSREVVAMSGPCRGVRGTYVWYCTPEQYSLFEAYGHKVNVATISTEKVMRRGR